jgi:hypothetical protein
MFICDKYFVAQFFLPMIRWEYLFNLVPVMLLSNTLQFVSDLRSQTLFGQGIVPNIPACSSVCLHLLHPFDCAPQKVRVEELFVLFHCFQPTFLELCDLLLLMFKTCNCSLKHLLWRLCFEERDLLHHCKHKLIYVLHFQYIKASVSTLNKLTYLLM